MLSQRSRPSRRQGPRQKAWLYRQRLKLERYWALTGNT